MHKNSSTQKTFCVAAVLAATLVCPPASSIAQSPEDQEGLVLGDWTLHKERTGWAQWSARAVHISGRRATATVKRRLQGGPGASDAVGALLDVVSPVAGQVRVTLSPPSSVDKGFPALVRETARIWSLSWETPEQCVVVKADFDHRAIVAEAQRELGDSPDLKSVILERSAAEAVAAAVGSPEFELLRTLVETNPVLHREVSVYDYPEVAASIDGGAHVPLESRKARSSFREWILPARPGQRVAFRLRFPGRRRTFRPRRLEEDTSEGVLEGHPIALWQHPPGTNNPKRGTPLQVQTEVDSNGMAWLDYGTLKTARALVLGFPNWRFSSQDVLGFIRLRWGRPVEDWLESGRFALTPAENGGNEALLAALLRDLDAAYDPDREAFLERRGRSRTASFSERELWALSGLDIDSCPALRRAYRPPSLVGWMVREFWHPARTAGLDSLDEGIPLGEEGASRLLDQVGGPGHARDLWNPLGSPEVLGGWHSPKSVFLLALLWEAYPRLRSRNPLRRTLDFWVDAIQVSPYPVASGGKTRRYTPVVHPLGLSAAAAALHIGHRAIGDEGYTKALDAVLEALRAVPEGCPFYDALTAGTPYESVDESGVIRANPRRMCDFVALYGQLCALIGDEAELEKARAWIRAALLRRGDAFTNYEQATFRQRCGMVATLRRSHTCFELPPDVSARQ